MKNHLKLAAMAALLAGTVVLSTGASSAAVVCNGSGQCWHAARAYSYRPEYGVVVHPNGWKWGAGEHYAWREHPGRGYWHNGVWIRF